MRFAVTGVGALSAAGRGAGAVLDRADAGETAIGGGARYPTDGLTNPRGGFVRGRDAEALGLDDRPAEALLLAAVSEALSDALSAAALGEARIGLVVGTSSGNLCGPWERWHRAVLAGEVPPFDEAIGGREAPGRAIADRLGLRGPTACLSVACASGTANLAIATGWLRDGLADVVIAAGVDALSLFVHAGFSGLGALCTELPHPFRADRDGLALGEGAAALAVEPLDRALRRGARVLAEVRGVGLSCDARHMTAPHREGRGVVAAIGAALGEAGLRPDGIDMVSVHGTGTRYNDAMEAHALRGVFGDRPLAVHGVKQVVGHLLGAAGALECAAVVHALAAERWPTPVRDVDPELPWAPDPQRDGPPRIAVVTSSAFGGINAAAVLSAWADGAVPAEADPIDVVDVIDVVDAFGAIDVRLAPADDLKAAWPDAPSRASRLDRYGRVGLWAICRANAAVGGLPSDAGVVLATRFGCREADWAHHERIVAEGAGRASRIAFAATVPSAPAAEGAVLLGLQGPQLAFVVGADGDLGIGDAEAMRLIRHGRARVLVSLRCDARGPDDVATATVRVFAAPGALPAGG